MKHTLLFFVALLPTAAFAQRDCQSGITFSPPITISRGGTYTGNWKSSSASAPAVMITTTDPVTIISSRLMGPGDILTQMWNGNVTIRNDCFIGTNPNIRGTAKGSAVRIQNPTVLVVENNDFLNTGGNGVGVTEYWGNYTRENTIKVRYNRFFEVDGRYSDGAGGYLTNDNGFPSHAVILSLVKGVPGIEIAWNQVVNTPGNSQDTDSINLFSSSGTNTSHLLVHDNYVRGQYSANPTNPDGLRYGGTGIVTDDLPGIIDPAAATRFVDIFNNQVVSIALGGISISAGNNNAVYNNRVISSGRLNDGRIISSVYAAGVGTNNYLNETAGVYGDNSVFGNVSATNRPSASWKRQDFYFGVSPYYEANNTSITPVSDTAPTTVNEESEWVAWQFKLSSQGIIIGSTLLR